MMILQLSYSKAVRCSGRVQVTQVTPRAWLKPRDLGYHM